MTSVNVHFEKCWFWQIRDIMMERRNKSETNKRHNESEEMKFYPRDNELT